ncbi:MAG: thioredoxin family protein [Bacteroidales bacterium]|nr:thioredoxin family protein [Bacteroidales bacterium]
MKKITLLIVLSIFSVLSFAQGYNVGDKAISFKLKNVDGKMVSTADYNNAKGFIVIFTCNTCPYAVAYEDRIIELNNKYEKKGYPVIAINPNDPEVQPADTYELMVAKAKEKSFTFPYLWDPDRKVSAVYGATKTPQIYILNKEGKDLVVEYIGAIDDNFEDASAVSKKYVESAVSALLARKKPSPDFTKAIGCSVKKKKV